MERKNKDAKVKPEKKQSKKVKKAWRFFRSNLSTLVWDAEAGPDGGIMANFSKGHFTTKDKKVADKLKGMGYPEIALNATSPPNIIVNQPIHVLKDGVNVPIMTNGINEVVGQQRMDNLTEEVKAPEVL